jgi:hypothetical protein
VVVSHVQKADLSSEVKHPLWFSMGVYEIEVVWDDCDYDPFGG